ncbi:MAG: lipoprotein, partial [Ruminococcus sp.]|nr:lipoprotein [Ruminococcus sp.]
MVRLTDMQRTERSRVMKKMITIILAAALLTGCNSAATQPMQPQNDFTMCGVTVT